MSNIFIILLYLVSIISANLLVATFGTQAVIIVAFLFIGLDITARDKLHEAWRNEGLVWKMGLLIAVGSILSYLLNRNSASIAIASFVAFASASIVDAIIYHLLRNKKYLVKVNGSNVFSALVDSIVFPTIAFGGFLPLVTLGQFGAKILGGFVWSIILRKRK